MAMTVGTVFEHTITGFVSEQEFCFLALKGSSPRTKVLHCSR
jgi:hypothetical protein